MRLVSCNMIRRMEKKIKKKSIEEISGTGCIRAEKDENKAKKNGRWKTRADIVCSQQISDGFLIEI